MTYEVVPPTGAFPDSAPDDPNFASVSLLMRCDSTFADVTGKTMTANGNAVISTSEKKFGAGSGYFDGSGDYVSTPNATGFDLGSGDFTIECWFNHQSQTGVKHLIGKWDGSGDQAWHIYLNARTIGFELSTTGSYQPTYSFVSDSNEYAYDTWTHVAAVRDGNTLRLMVNGSMCAQKDVSGVTIYNSTNTIKIGGNTASQDFKGYIDEIRITKGVARYEAPLKLESITPNSGPIAGGTAVTLAGRSFISGITATIDGNAITSLTRVNSYTLTGNTPAGSAGTKDVTVVNP